MKESNNSWWILDLDGFDHTELARKWSCDLLEHARLKNELIEVYKKVKEPELVKYIEREREAERIYNICLNDLKERIYRPNPENPFVNSHPSVFGSVAKTGGV